MSQICRICASSDEHKSHLFRERMFGWGDQFAYFKCGACGCLQIADIPSDLGRFYPPHYYSFHLQPVPQAGWKSRLAARRDLAVVTNCGMGLWLRRLLPARIDIECLGRVPLTSDMRLLDVGCGRGQLLSVLHRAGFRHLLGVDPYIPQSIELFSGLRLLKCEVTDLEQEFDFIMLHHVLEHIADGVELLRACRSRLAPGGLIMIRIPTVSCASWERYGQHWVQLDAPRHLFLHTPESLAILAQRAGLTIRHSWYDSTMHQFIGSELYLKGLPLVDAQGKPTPTENLFTPSQMRSFRREAEKLNAARQGDQMVVLLEVTSGH